MKRRNDKALIDVTALRATRRSGRAYGFVLVVIGLMLIGLQPARAIDQARLEQFIVVPGAVAVAAVRSSSTAVNWKLQDDGGNVVSSGRVTPNNGQAEVTTPVPSSGYFELVLSDDASEKRLALVGLEAPGKPDPRFGVMTHFAQGWDTSLIPLISRLGVANIRDEIYWSSFEKTPGNYAVLDSTAKFMAALAEARIDPLIILSFGNTNYDRGLTPFTDDGRRAYAEYAKHLIGLFPSQIKAVEVWNEYNGGFCKGPCSADRANFYSLMLKEVSAQLRQAYPSIQIVGVSSDHVPIPYFQALANHAPFGDLDAISIHPYRDIEEGIVEDITKVREIAGRTGASRPIWATEYGVIGKPRRETADYLVRMTTLLVAADVKRLYWYLFKDTSAFTGMGLIKSGESPGQLAPTPAYAAYGSLIHALAGTRYDNRLALDPRTHLYRFERDDGPVYVAWSLSGVSTLCFKQRKDLTIYNSLGRPLSPKDGSANGCTDVSFSPIIVKGAGRDVTEKRDDRFLATTFSNVATQEAQRFQPGYRLKSGSAEIFDLKSMSTAWAYYLGSSAAPGLTVTDTSMCPGSQNGEQFIPFKRWVATKAAHVRVEGYVERPGTKGTGSVARITQDGKTVAEWTFARGAPKKREAFDVALDVTAGSKIELSVESIGSTSYGDVSSAIFVSEMRR